jgi:hypothetical protein
MQEVSIRRALLGRCWHQGNSRGNGNARLNDQPIGLVGSWLVLPDVRSCQTLKNQRNDQPRLVMASNSSPFEADEVRGHGRILSRLACRAGALLVRARPAHTKKPCVLYMALSRFASNLEVMQRRGMTRVLVCGGRNFGDIVLMGTTMKRLHAERSFTIVIHGDAKGADRHADAWARLNRVEVMPFPARWREEGVAAGPLRNQRMIDEGMPDLVIAFPGGNGTADMVAKARRAGIEVIEV